MYHCELWTTFARPCTIHRSYSDQMLLLRFHACESETLETHSFHLHTNKDASKYSQNINVRRGHSKLNAAH